MNADWCDGMDVLAVRSAAQQAAEEVRRGEPRFLECRTCRFRAHSMFDAELYRAKEEVEQWKARDPIDGLAAKLTATGELTDAALAAIEAEVAAEISEAVAFAERGTWEPVEQLTRDVYTREAQAR
jgi:TPP-dependent pyruvate/acetoin dehydrogenase alpha subunit